MKCKLAAGHSLNVYTNENFYWSKVHRRSDILHEAPVCLNHCDTGNERSTWEKDEVET